MLIFTCSYWTDNRACYYYTTANFSNYEEVIVAVKVQADKDGIPYRYVQVTFLTYNTYVHSKKFSFPNLPPKIYF